MADFREKFLLAFSNWRFRIASIFFLLGVFVFSLGLGLLIFKKDTDSEVKFISPSEVLGETKVPEVVVDVDGAVVSPGVYRLSGDVRAGDAIAAAGGLNAEADSSRVNLASKISDGQKILVPLKQEQATSEQGDLVSLSQDVSSLVSINGASEAELDTLPGIGPVTAGKIIAARPYASVEELLSKKAVTKSVFDKIKDLVTI